MLRAVLASARQECGGGGGHLQPQSLLTALTQVLADNGRGAEYSHDSAITSSLGAADHEGRGADRKTRLPSFRKGSTLDSVLLRAFGRLKAGPSRDGVRCLPGSKVKVRLLPQMKRSTDRWQLPSASYSSPVLQPLPFLGVENTVVQGQNHGAGSAMEVAGRRQISTSLPSHPPVPCAAHLSAEHGAIQGPSRAYLVREEAGQAGVGWLSFIVVRNT